MSDTLTIPCVELPKIDIPSISLLGGAELKGFADFSLGAPTDCKLTFNLLLQLAPLLASMACIFKIFNVFVKLEDFLNAATNPPFKDLPGTVPGVVDAIAELKKCIPIPGIDLYLMITGILKLVVDFLSCFIDSFGSILEFHASIDLSAADDNPVLRAGLVCAQHNAKQSMDNMMLSLQPLQPIMKVATMLIGLAKLPIQLPDLSNLSVSADANVTIASLKQAVDALKSAVASIPGQ
jgi:hypothetical protein